MHNSWSRVLIGRHRQCDDEFTIPSNWVVSHSYHIRYTVAPIINGKLLRRCGRTIIDLRLM